MPGKQKPAISEMTAEPPQNQMLGRLVKIDEHIAAENNVHFAADLYIVVHQVQAAMGWMQATVIQRAVPTEAEAEAVVEFALRAILPGEPG